MTPDSSTSTIPLRSTSAFVRSSPIPALFGRRPTATSTRSNACSVFWPSFSKATAIPPPASRIPATLVWRWIASKIFSTRAASSLTRSRSAPGSSPSVNSTTVTRLPSSA